MVCLYIRVSWGNPGTQQFPSKGFRYAFVELDVIARLPLFFIFLITRLNYLLLERHNITRHCKNVFLHTINRFF